MAAHIGRSEVSLKHDCDVAEAGSIPETDSDGLQCNICLASAQEPVVTLCGHLYCWPCIYKWLHVQESYDESHQQPQCPICKANISESTLVPLYGRDASSSESRATEQEFNIPNRPAFSSYNLQRLMQQSSQSANHWDDTSRGPHPSLAAPSSLQIDFEAVSALLNPITCKFGEMVYARIFGGSGANSQSYPYAASYPQISSTNPRIQRQEKELEKSLNRVTSGVYIKTYKFGLQHGNEDTQKDVIHRCVAAEPKHCEIWQSVSKAIENSHLPVEAIYFEESGSFDTGKEETTTESNKQ